MNSVGHRVLSLQVNPLWEVHVLGRQFQYGHVVEGGRANNHLKSLSGWAILWDLSMNFMDDFGRITSTQQGVRFIEYKETDLNLKIILIKNFPKPGQGQYALLEQVL